MLKTWLDAMPAGPSYLYSLERDISFSFIYLIKKERILMFGLAFKGAQAVEKLKLSQFGWCFILCQTFVILLIDRVFFYKKLSHHPSKLPPSWNEIKQLDVCFIEQSCKRSDLMHHTLDLQVEEPKMQRKAPTRLHGLPSSWRDYSILRSL